MNTASVGNLPLTSRAQDCLQRGKYSLTFLLSFAVLRFGLIQIIGIVKIILMRVSLRDRNYLNVHSPKHEKNLVGGKGHRE